MRKDGWQAIGLSSNDPKATLNNVRSTCWVATRRRWAPTAAPATRSGAASLRCSPKLELPVTQTLSFNLAARGDEYRDLKKTSVNPKISARWQPSKTLMVRASANTGFRAPALPEIYSKETERTAIATFDDPVLCPQTGGVDTPAPGYTVEQVCNLTGRNQVTKVPGNFNISPEKSKSWTAGFALEPVKGLSTSVDYWETEITEVIGNRAITFILNNPGLYTDLFRRNPDGTLATDAVFNPPSNLGKIRGAGLDVSLNYALPAMPLGRVAFGIDVAYLTKWDAATPEVAGGDYQSALGQYNDVVPVNPNAGLSNATRGLNHRWRHTAKVALLEKVEMLAKAKDPRVVQVMAGLAAEHDVVTDRPCRRHPGRRRAAADSPVRDGDRRAERPPRGGQLRRRRPFRARLL